MTDKRHGVAVMAEVVAVLARYPCLRVSPVVDNEDGVLTLAVRVDGADSLHVLALADELQYVADVAQMRMLAATYGIAPAALEAMLPQLRDQPRAALSVPEIEAVMHVLRGDLLASADTPTEHDKLLDSALVKLVELARAMG
jgi:hypothetical protein